LKLKNSSTSQVRQIGLSLPVVLQGLGLNSVYKSNLSFAEMHSERSVIEFQNVKIITIPATADNFMYLLIDKASFQAAVVDPVEPETILDVIRKENVTLTSILTTHHHWDHAGGNEKMVKLYSAENGDNSAQLAVYGGDDRIGGLTKKVGDKDKIDLGSLTIDCMFTPCHTTGHICYYVPASGANMDKPAVFTGDTLFVAGCGRFFEGTGDQMYTALLDKLGNLPNETLVFCGHEYTVDNLKFSLHVEPSNQVAQEKLGWAQNQRSTRLPTVPSTIGEEKQINPFMRVGLPELLRGTGTTDPISCMTALRNLKNNFKA